MRFWHHTGARRIRETLAIAATALVTAFNRPLRMTVAGLWLVGVAFAGFTAPRAWHRTGVHGYKARELHDLGVDPELGVALNLLYSAVASLVFAWLVARWFKNRSRFNP